MFLETHQLFVRFSDRKLQEGKPVLEARAWLVCPHCASPHEATTTPELLKERIGQYLGRKHQETPPAELPPTIYPVEQYRATILSALGNARYCEVCGVSSNLPKSDANRLKKELEQQLTQEWVEAQVTLLDTKLAYASHLVTVKAERELPGWKERRLGQLHAVQDPPPPSWEPPTLQANSPEPPVPVA